MYTTKLRKGKFKSHTEVIYMYSFSAKDMEGLCVCPHLSKSPALASIHLQGLRVYSGTVHTLWERGSFTIWHMYIYVLVSEVSSFREEIPLIDFNKENPNTIIPIPQYMHMCMHESIMYVQIHV